MTFYLPPKEKELLFCIESRMSQGGPQLKILACCMAKNLDIVRECMCAKREDPCGWGPRPAQGP